MRKFFTCVCLMITTTIVKAGTEVRLLGGDFSFLRDSNEQMLFEIDYSETIVDEVSIQQYLESRGADFVRDWPQDSKTARERFVYFFNKSKGVQICESTDDNPKYKMVMHVKTLDMGDAGSSVASVVVPYASAKAGGVIANVVVDVAEYPSGKAVAKFSIPKIKGIGSVSETVRLGLCYTEIAKQIVKAGKKNRTNLPIDNSDINIDCEASK